MTVTEPHSSDHGPSRPEQLTVDFRQSDEGLAVTAGQSRGPAGFLLLWQIAWTVGCVHVGVEFIRNPVPGTFLFALPFWTAWLAVGCFLIWSFFGTETLLVRRDRVLFLRKALITLTAREIPISEVRRFRSCRSKHQENDEYLYGIEVVTAGKSVRFAFRIPDRERRWLIWQLNQFAATVADESSAEQTTDYDFALAQSHQDSTTRLTANDVQDDPPSDVSWQLQERADGVEFTQRGRFQIVTFLVLLGINAFWNGIVSVFVLALFGLMPGDNPQGAEWWSMFVFLIPFEVIGLVMFIGLVMTVVEPFRRIVWRLDRQELVHQSRWPLVSYSWSWNLDQLDHLQLRKDDDDSLRRSRSSLSSGISEENRYQLTFVSADNVDQATISPLTEGESRWMAGVLLRHHAPWSRGWRLV